MSKKAADNKALLQSIAQNLFNALPIFRKRVLHLDAIQRECHIPLSHVQVLALLQDHGSMSVSEISQRLGIAKPNITPLADRLITDGLAERQRDHADRRVVNIHILPQGTEKLQTVRENLIQQVDGWAERYTHAELKELDKALSTVIRILGRINE